MCGRYLVITEDEIIEMRAILQELNQRFSDSDDLFTDSSISNNAETAPGLTTPILVEHENLWRLQPMKWGFTRWDGKGSVINARAESVQDKSFFRDSFMHRRCIIPSRGFFEWMKSSSPTSSGADSGSDISIFDVVKEDGLSPGKYWIRRKDSSLFLMAGIFNKSRDREADEYVILTMPANSQISLIHDRMPVFLEKSQLIPWMRDPGSIRQLLDNQESSVSFTISMAGKVS